MINESSRKPLFLRYIFRIFPVIFFAIVSCSQSSDAPISNLRVNEGADDEIKLGQKTLIQADLLFASPIQSLRVALRSSDGEEIDLLWPSIDDATGKNKYALSQHVDIPAIVRPGKYWLVLSVDDIHSDIVQDSILLNLVLDNTIPIIEDLDVGINKNGNDLHLEAAIMAIKKIDRVVVNVTGEAWSKEAIFDKKSLKDQLSVTFHEHLHVDQAPSGAYTVAITVYDQAGRSAEAKGNFRK